MCELNILIKENKKNVVGFLQSTTTLSYLNHNDSDGFYCDFNNRVFKQKEKIDYSLFTEDLNNSNFILNHTRTATSGKTEKYAHPFFNENFVLIMNGIISKYATKKQSDTYKIFEKFNLLFSKSDAINREEKIKEAINSIFDDSRGYFSIAIFDKLEKQLYYFKDDVAKISIFRGEDYLFLTTNDKNKNFLNFIGDKFDEYKAEDYKIYKISCKEKIKVSSIGDIKPFSYVYESKKEIKKTKKLKNKTEKSDIKNNYQKTIRIIKVRDSILTIEERQSLTYCAYCGNTTKNFCLESGLRVCENCIYNNQDFLSEIEIIALNKYSNKNNIVFKDRGENSLKMPERRYYKDGV